MILLRILHSMLPIPSTVWAWHDDGTWHVLARTRTRWGAKRIERRWELRTGTNDFAVAERGTDMNDAPRYM